MPVWIDRSRFPKAMQQLLQESLRARRVDHQLHYQSFRQAQRWMALHQAHAPSCAQTRGAEVYRAGFDAALAAAKLGREFALISLGCGAGEKEEILFGRLPEEASVARYVPCDASVPLVLEASQRGEPFLAAERIRPLVCDLIRAEDLAGAIEAQAPAEIPRLIVFFGLLPNFEPEAAEQIWRAVIRPQDLILISANLVPGQNAADEMRRALPAYDNDLTRRWLEVFLWDNGFELADGQIRFRIETPPRAGGLSRICAEFEFSQGRCVTIDAEVFRFQAGDRLRLFFSYRHRAADMPCWLAARGLSSLGEWVAPDQSEGVYLCVRAPG